MYHVEIHNSQTVLPLDEDFLREVAERTLAAEGVAGAEVSVAVVDNETIHELNRRYLEHDYETDVLSFLLDCEEGDGDGTPAGDERVSSTEMSVCRGVGKRIEGEVIVSAEMALQRAAEFAWKPQDELVLYLVHGLLHLVGYDDLTEAEQRMMRRREREILACWNLSPAASAGEDESSGRSSTVRRPSGAES